MLGTEKSVAETNNGALNETPSLVKKERKLMNSDNTEVQFPSGSRYVGSIRNGQLSGYGKYYYFPSGDIYEGEWDSDMKQGQGTYTYANGDHYIGEWYRGKKHNRGTYVFSNGDKYVGFWKDDKIHGYGAFTIKNGGNRYEGFWEEAYRHGHGILYNSNGDIYDGEWVRGKEEGFGIFIQSIGSIYCGDWKDGEMDGKGVLKEHRILYAVEFIRGYAVSRVPIPEDSKPAPEWLKAYEFYMTYTGNHYKYGDRSIQDMDEMRHALEKMKLESALWKKRYDNLLSKSLESRKDVQVSSIGVGNSEYESGTLKESNHLIEVEDISKTKMISHIDQIGTPRENSFSLVDVTPTVEYGTENKPPKESKETNVGKLMNGKGSTTELKKDSSSSELQRSEIVKLRQHNVELMRNNVELEKHKTNITAEKDELVRKLNSYTDKVEDLERQLNEVTSMEFAASREVTVLRNRVQEVEEALDKKNNHEITNADTQVQQRRLEEMERKLGDVNRANAELQLYSDALKKEVNQYRDQYRALVNQKCSGNDTEALTQLQMDLERVEGQLRAAEENARTQQIEFDSCKSHCMDLESSLLVMARQKVNDPKILLALDRKIDLLRGLQEKNAELSRILEETKVELEISKKQTDLERDRKRSIQSSEANVEDELKQVLRDLKREQKKYKKAQTAREALAVDLYEEQVKHARVERVLQSLQGCFTVIARIQNCKEGSTNPCVHVNEMDYSQVLLKNGDEKQTFQFDVCFDDNASWDAIFNEIRRPITIVKMGFHVSYITLGAIHTGKTRMFNELIPLIINYLCDQCRQHSTGKYDVTYKIGAVEVSASGAVDCETGKVLTEVQHDAHGFSVPLGVTFVVTTESDILSTLEKIHQRQRQNRRSHIWIQIQCFIMHKVKRTYTVGRVTLVDLCGPGPLLLQENDLEGARFANRSFGYILGVLGALQDKEEVVPYTQSFETCLLSDVFGGNALTTILGTLSSSEEDLGESRQTLRALSMALKAVNGPILPYFVSSDELRWREAVTVADSAEAALPVLVSIDGLKDY